MADAPVEPRREGRYSERALVLTIATVILLTPPILTIFDVSILIFGVPLLHVYSFAVWLAAIGFGFLLIRRMTAEEAAPPEGTAPPSPPPPAL